MPKGPNLSFNPDAGMNRAVARSSFVSRAAALMALLIGSTALTGVVLSPTHAATPQWLGTVSSNWFAAGNWNNPSAVPNAADNVTIDTTSPHATVINGGAATGQQMIVGNAGNGNLAITNGGGLAISGFGYLGFSANSIGTASVDGAGSNWTGAAGLVVGSAGSGTLTISNVRSATLAASSAASRGLPVPSPSAEPVRAGPTPPWISAISALARSRSRMAAS
jgi:T5SS/PEP-CTERM-associated repeat protein